MIWAGMDEDRFLGPCKVCEEAGRKHEDGSPNMLRMIRALKGGKRFVGCEGWDRDDPESPDSCDQTFPLPAAGRCVRLEERCSICGETPRLKVNRSRGRPWELCLNDDCPSMEEMKRRRAEREAARAAREAAEANGDAATGDGAKPTTAPAAGDGAKRRRRAKALAQDAAGTSGPGSSSEELIPGVFVTLEGIDRSGKTTQAALLAEALGPETLLLREPGGTDAGERIRALLKDPAIELDPRTELLLFCAARAELCARLVRPALEAGRDVVCDRFVDSTVAYQGAARGLGTELVESLNEIAIAGCVPDVTVLLRIDPENAEARGQQRLARGGADGIDRFEERGDRVPAPGRGRLRRPGRPSPRADRGGGRERQPRTRCTPG